MFRCMLDVRILELSVVTICGWSLGNGPEPNLNEAVHESLISLVPSRKHVQNIHLVTFSNILGLHLIFIAQLSA